VTFQMKAVAEIFRNSITKSASAEDASERIQDREMGLSMELRTRRKQQDSVRGNAAHPVDFLVSATCDIATDE
jgi:hypothetical protein